jgi:hypothetical protein
MPGLEVCDLDSADAEQDPQNFHAAHPLGQRRIQTAAALFDKSKVKTCRVDDRLKEASIVGISVGAWNCGMFTDR